MKIVCKVLMIIFLFPLVLFATEESQQNVPQVTPEALAIAGAARWLKVIDDDNYDKGWVYASEYLKNAVTKDDFKEKLQGVRNPLGRMKKRVLTASKFATSLPGAPDGEWVVMKYTTEFANKANAVETLISKKEPDGQWKVAGYYIKD